ncbi:hypothetical protein H0H92_015910 [Tricholoma furcatifolium]|nr:hypothetical protein H0H92_015910 [Tricholoma furcatifolium]
MQRLGTTVIINTPPPMPVALESEPLAEVGGRSFGRNAVFTLGTAIDSGSAYATGQNTEYRLRVEGVFYEDATANQVEAESVNVIGQAKLKGSYIKNFLRPATPYDPNCTIRAAATFRRSLALLPPSPAYEN